MQDCSGNGIQERAAERGRSDTRSGRCRHPQQAGKQFVDLLGIASLQVCRRQPSPCKTALIFTLNRVLVLTKRCVSAAGNHPSHPWESVDLCNPEGFRWSGRRHCQWSQSQHYKFITSCTSSSSSSCLCKQRSEHSALHYKHARPRHPRPISKGKDRPA